MCGLAATVMSPPPLPLVLCLGWRMEGRMDDGTDDRTDGWKRTATQAYYISRHGSNTNNDQIELNLCQRNFSSVHFLSSMIGNVLLS